MNSVAYEVISLKLRWRELRERSEGVTLHETIEWPHLTKENRQLIAIEPFDVRLYGTVASGIGIVTGEMQSRATYRCSRCLCDFTEELRVPIVEHFVQKADDELSEADKFAGLDEENRTPVVGETIDLEPHLEQTVQLALPYNPVCKQDCAGLCPECGVNRNEVTCSCNTERIDPRLADLAKFFEKDSE
jgi:uncharacterized protein